MYLSYGRKRTRAGKCLFQSSNSELLGAIYELPDEHAMLMEIQPPWKIYFDGVLLHEGVGVGVVCVTMIDDLFPLV